MRDRRGLAVARAPDDLLVDEDRAVDPPLLVERADDRRADVPVAADVRWAVLRDPAARAAGVRVPVLALVAIRTA